jgi:hypothetical protein
MPISIRSAVLIYCAISLSSVAYAQGQWSTVQLPGDHPEVFALAVHGAKQQLFIGTGGLPNARANARSFAATDGLMAIGAFRGAGSVYQCSPACG